MLRERPGAIIGAYPVTDDQLGHMLAVELHELGGPLFAPSGQSRCLYCRQPTWERNDDCGLRHPFNRLRFGT